jgi:hypothetical protein
MSNLIVYSLSLLFLRGLLTAEEHRLAYYIGQLRKLPPLKIIIRGSRFTFAF